MKFRLRLKEQMYASILNGPSFTETDMNNCFCIYSWFARDVTKILKSKLGGLQNFYLLLMKDYLKIYPFTIP